MIPAVLVALMRGPSTAAIVAGMYILIQVVESDFITPMVQQKLISIPKMKVYCMFQVKFSFFGSSCKNQLAWF